MIDKKIKCRDLEDKKVKLTHPIKLLSGKRYDIGTEFVIVNVWRGRFNLKLASGGYARGIERYKLELV